MARALLHLLMLSLLAPGGLGAEAVDPWELLAAVRRDLTAAGLQQADFEQTYLPAGFSQGETESGRLVLGLPDCLRWDYREPYPKSFVVCGELASYWNPEDGTGRRQPIDRENEPGLDLLLLPTGALGERYQARAEADPGGGMRITLTPRDGSGEVEEAVLLLDPAAGTVRGLAFTDREGNLTRFRIDGYQPAREPGLFSPPPGIAWAEEEGFP